LLFQVRAGGFPRQRKKVFWFFFSKKNILACLLAGRAQPPLYALVSLARALHVSLDALVFEEGERGPSEEMRLQFEAVSPATRRGPANRQSLA